MIAPEGNAATMGYRILPTPAREGKGTGVQWSMTRRRMRELSLSQLSQTSLDPAKASDV
jgi:hypothetical protein